MIVVDVAGGWPCCGRSPLTQVADGMPQDIKLAPGRPVFYVADMMANGV